MSLSTIAEALDALRAGRPVAARPGAGRASTGGGSAGAAPALDDRAGAESQPRDGRRGKRDAGPVEAAEPGAHVGREQRPGAQRDVCVGADHDVGAGVGDGHADGVAGQERKELRGGLEELGLNSERQMAGGHSRARGRE